MLTVNELVPLGSNDIRIITPTSKHAIAFQFEQAKVYRDSHTNCLTINIGMQNQQYSCSFQLFPSGYTIASIPWDGDGTCIHDGIRKGMEYSHINYVSDFYRTVKNYCYKNFHFRIGYLFAFQDVICSLMELNNELDSIKQKDVINKIHYAIESKNEYNMKDHIEPYGVPYLDANVDDGYILWGGNNREHHEIKGFEYARTVICETVAKGNIRLGWYFDNNCEFYKSNVKNKPSIPMFPYLPHRPMKDVLKLMDYKTRFDFNLAFNRIKDY